ncbi:MAG TPA: sensor histidine kinase [Streptosporangiaceae bacterium]
MRALSRRAPWSPRSWCQALYLAGGIPAQLALLFVLAFPALVAKPKNVAPVLPLWLLLMLLVLPPVLTTVHRHRLRATGAVEIPRIPVGMSRWSWPGIVAYARAKSTWRQVGYHLAAGPLLAAAAIATVAMWLAGTLYALVYLYAWRMNADGMLRKGVTHRPNLGFLHPVAIPVDVYLTTAGIAGLLVAPWATAGVVALDARVSRALLGPSRAEELEHRVEELAETRAGVVDAADAERRRLERDLHDGTQQRLVSLAMNLGMARVETATVEEAHQAITEAHEEAKAALTELRNLVRGLHPPVLEDRGLDAALSGVAARMPIPVRLTVDVPRRPSPTIEAVAYFVVSEGLTNITKHAEASQAEVFVQRTGDRLHIIVTDDGVGGADLARGTGLAGLTKRAASVDGTFEIVSPPGGPTLLTVDLPCKR